MRLIHFVPPTDDDGSDADVLFWILGIRRADSGGARIGPIRKLSQGIPDRIPQSME